MLNNIVLNASMLENLYPHALVEVADRKPETSAPVKFLGNNVANVTILISNAAYRFLPEDQLSFLNKLLLACNMNTGDVAIVNTAAGTTAVDAIQQLHPQKVIAFGVDIPGERLFSPDLSAALPTLLAPGLDELISDRPEAKQLKAKLWSCLKTLFSIA